MSENDGWTYPDTSDWYEIEFEAYGHTFVSKFDKSGDMYQRVLMVPRGILEVMNRGFIIDTLGDITNWTKQEIAKALEDCNQYAQEAVIELVG